MATQDRLKPIITIHIIRIYVFLKMYVNHDS